MTSRGRLARQRDEAGLETRLVAVRGVHVAELAKPLAEQSLKIAYVPVRREEGDLYEMWRDAASAPLDGSGSGRSA